MIAVAVGTNGRVAFALKFWDMKKKKATKDGAVVAATLATFYITDRLTKVTWTARQGRAGRLE